MKHQKKKQLFATKLTDKIPDPPNVKEYCESFLRKKSTKLVKIWSKFKARLHDIFFS